ncbi:MAG: cob(I)yrinic acid a,c-diamide adenosyltransferase [Cyclobacteriaceae bacterium]
MKIYTKTGDEGKTSLLGGTRVPKYHLRIESYGTIDELNSYMGLLRSQDVNQVRQSILQEIQERLFTIGSSLAAENDRAQKLKLDLTDADVEQLEEGIDQMNEVLEPMRSFILPGGHQSVAFCHIARCVCRRAERLIIHLSEKEHVDARVIIYLNRLSDFLFVLARKMTYDLQLSDIPWLGRKG